MNLKYLSCCCLAGFLFSCDCIVNGSGIIVDLETHKPIGKVEIREIGKTDKQYSDENGFFEIHRISGGFKARTLT